MIFILLLILTLISGFFLPWWFISIFAFIIAYYLGKKPWSTFFLSFLAVFLAWLILALLRSIPNDQILVVRITKLFHLPHWIFLFIITCLIGGLIAGISGITGFYFKKDFSNEK